MKIESLKLHMREYFYFKKTNLINVYIDFDDAIIYQKNPGAIFAKQL